MNLVISLGLLMAMTLMIADALQKFEQQSLKKYVQAWCAEARCGRRHMGVAGGAYYYAPHT